MIIHIITTEVEFLREIFLWCGKLPCGYILVLTKAKRVFSMSRHFNDRLFVILDERDQNANNGLVHLQSYLRLGYR